MKANGLTPVGLGDEKHGLGPIGASLLCKTGTTGLQTARPLNSEKECIVQSFFLHLLKKYKKGCPFSNSFRLLWMDCIIFCLENIVAHHTVTKV
jgi:hypothetical protein